MKCIDKEKKREGNRRYYQDHKEEMKECNKRYRQENKERVKEYQKQYRQTRKEEMKEHDKRYYQDHKEYYQQYRQENKEKRRECSKQYRQENKEKINECHKQYYQKHKEKVKEYNKQYRQNHKEERNKQESVRYRTNVGYNLNRRMTSMIHASLHNGSGKQGHHWEALVGYTSEQLKKHLKKTIPDGYSWQDYLEGSLHIDHKFPISVFNITSLEDINFQRCWALKNLQLLPAEENLRKHTKLIKPFQGYFPIKVGIVRKNKKR